ncbi:MAG: SufBD protein [candidate division CPR1 bacterium GW2011_GWC1_49_13]|uniref:SufBD protein n=1 Tax=candidate division CPR1 bacterium GW2011_GWC1_49_13 TaxID=1618342 RepID=A0A0G1VI25_9BACT|nr:MAG: SufBD protein [candidate division CPR1 bacterium GW2011_GWC1_49_13]
MIFVPVTGTSTKKLTVLLNRKGKEEELVLVFAGKGKDEIDLDLASIHRAPATRGKITVRGVLQGQARARIKGLIKIEKGAPGSRDFLEERTLLLGTEATVETVPDLEIEENDVSASHAASTARVGEEELFYLNSRGISEKDATRLLVEGFLAAALPVEGKAGKAVVSKLRKVQEYALD